MAQVLVRDLEEKTLAVLKGMAERHRRSLNQEIRVLLETAAATAEDDPLQIAERIRLALAERSTSFSDSGRLQAEDRSR
jgi:antitoxin FitA